MIEIGDSRHSGSPIYYGQRKYAHNRELRLAYFISYLLFGELNDCAINGKIW